MTFQDQMQADQAVFFNTGEFGIVGSYLVKKTAQQIPVTVIVTGLQDLAQTNFGLGQLATIDGQTSQVSRPEVHDEITVGGDVWVVQSVINSTADSWLVQAVSDRRVPA